MIDKLEFFIVLARAGHFGRAAEECGVAQPSLSAAIRHLEEQLGVQLVVRGSRYQGLTPEGQRVLEWAKRIVGDTRTMREEMRAARKGLSGHVKLAVIPTALAMVPLLTAPFQEAHPDVTFSIVSRTSLQILAQLDSFEIDAGITYLNNEPLGRVTSVPLYEEDYTLVTVEGSPYAGRETIRWSELADIRLGLLTPDMQNRRIINQQLANAGVSITPAVESSSIVALLSYVVTGKLCSIMPRSLSKSFGFAPSVRMIPIVEPEVSHTVGLVAYHREPFTPLVSALLHEARSLGMDTAKG